MRWEIDRHFVDFECEKRERKPFLGAVSNELKEYGGTR
jgi:hypothetical protein